MAYSRADVLATAARSPAAASARDREAWLGLFTPDARVEDPIGSQAHRGHAAIGRFFDTFIGPRDIAFLPDADIVSESTVIRDGVLQASLGSIALKVPIYIRYDLKTAEEDLKIAALSAYWELPAMVGQFIAQWDRRSACGPAVVEAAAGEPGGVRFAGILQRV